MNVKRAYTMTTRSAGAEETRRGILVSTFALLGEKNTLEIVLADVAVRSGVTVKTILRHFGSRDGLFEATNAYAQQEVLEERLAPVGDIPKAVAIIFDHYERRGDWVVRLIAQESSDERVRGVVQNGRDVHRQWVGTTFRPQLERIALSKQDAASDLLVVATDVYTWKLLRRDRMLDREEAEGRVRMMVRAILNENRERNR